jgi:hypothetical protein
MDPTENTSPNSQSQSHIATDGQSVSKSWCRAPSGAHGQILITLWQLRSCFVGRPLWREDGSVFCICSWSLPAQFFLGPCPLGLATIFYCLRFETSFSSPPTTRRVTVEVFDPASTRGSPNSSYIFTSYSCHTDCVQNTTSQLFHWCMLGICCLAMGFVYRVVT